MQLPIQQCITSILVQLLTFSIVASSSPQSGDPVPTPGSMAQGATTVLMRIQAPGTETTVTFSRFSTAASQTLTQNDSLICIIEALQEIYSSQVRYGISTHLAKPWVYSGSQQPKNQNCLTMQNQDDKDHILTWGIVVESLRAVALGLGNTTFTSAQFDVYSQNWGHLGYGSIGMQEAMAQTA